MTDHDDRAPNVGLLVTCLVDLMRPEIGFAAVALLEQTGCRVSVPERQTCCGQPAYNSGDNDDAAALARQSIAAFEHYDYVVTPSGSCGAMLKEHYPQLLADDAEWAQRAQRLASRTFELTSFLTDVLGVAIAPTRYEGRVTYHDSCSGLRELGVKRQPRQLLDAVAGLELVEMQDAEVCCGFGGTFCVKYPEISVKMVSDKIANVESTRSTTLLGGDLGCLLNIAGRLKRAGSAIKVLHVAEVLAGSGANAAGIGEGS